MKTIKKTKPIVLLVAVLALICISVFAACNKQSQSTRITILFDANDGSEIRSESVDPSNIAYSPSARPGYDFVGWTMDKQGRNPIDPSKLKPGTVLYAQWKIKTFSVNFCYGGDVVKSETVKYGQAAIAPTEDEISQWLSENESFDGWDADFSNVTSNLNVNAIIKTKEKEYSVSFKVGNDIVKTGSGKVGNDIVLPTQADYEDKIPDGFVFSKWIDDDGNEIASDAKYTSDATYTAKYALATPSAPVITVLYADEKKAFVYGETCGASIKKETAPDGIVYSYEWFDENGNTLDCSQDGSVLSIANANVGEIKITSKITASAEGYTSVFATSHATIVVEKATLSVVFDEINIVYGQDLPECSLRFNGFECEDDESVVDKTDITTSTSYKKGSGVGKYRIVISGLKANNYKFAGSGENGAIVSTINVGKRVLAIKDVALEKTYDGAPYSKTIDSGFSGLFGEDTATVSVSTQYSRVGQYSDTNSGLNILLAVKSKDGKDVSNNYTFENNLSVTINPATIKYTHPQDKTVTFNGKEHDIAIVQTETLGCEVFYSLSPNASDASFVATLKDAGVYTINYTIRRENYSSVNGSFKVTINKAKATISANSAQTIYGENFSLDQSNYTSTDLFGEEIKVTLSCTYRTGMSAGNYEIGLIAEENDNIDITCNNSTLAVKKANLVANIVEKTITYGDAFTPDFNIVKEIQGLYEGDKIQDLLKLETTYRQGDDVGTYRNTASLTDVARENYVLTCQSGNLSVDKKDLSLIMDSKDVVYGDSAPEYTARFEGLIDGDEIEFTLESDYEIGKGVGKYAITAKVPETSETRKNGNYNIKINGEAYMSVAKKHVTVTLADASVTYGDIAPTFAYTNEPAFVGNDIPTIEIATEYVQGAKVGKYAVTSQSSSKNYSIDYIPGTLTVNKRIATIEYENFNVAYDNGKKATFDIANCVKNGFDGDVFVGTLQTNSGDIKLYSAENDDDFASSFEYATALSIKNKNNEDVSDCYDIHYKVNVEIKEITIKHSVRNLSENQVYDGEAHDVYVEVENDTTVVYTVNGKEQKSNPSFVDAGEYVVSYNLVKDGSTPYSGKFTVKIAKKKAIVTVKDQSTLFNEAFALDQNKYTLDGVLEKDMNDVAVTLACDYKKGNDKGTYVISATATHKNYEFEKAVGTLFVNAKSVVLDSKTYTVIYGEAAPALDGFTSQSVNVALDFVRLSTKYKVGEFGEFEITATSENDNYTVDASALKLVVAKRDLNLSFDKSTLYATYGRINVKYTANGLLDKDKHELSVRYLSGETWNEIPSVLNAGKYEICIEQSVEIARKYNSTAQNDTLTVEKATLNIGIETKSLSLVFGEDVDFKAVYAGFVNNENESVLQGKLVFACEYIDKKHAGKFAVAMSGLSSNNYNIVYATDAELVVVRASATIKAKHQQTVYGQPFSLDESAFEIILPDGLNKYAVDESENINVSLSCNYVVYNNAQNYDIVLTATHDDFEIATENNTLSVEKANYSADEINSIVGNINLKGTYNPGMHLEAYNLPNYFAWAAPTAVPTCDKNEDGYAVTYCKDPTNYNVFTAAKVKIRLDKASPDLRLDGTLEYDRDGKDHSEDAKQKLKTSNADGGYSISLKIKAPFGIGKIVDGGVYTLTASISETTNYIAQSIDVILKVKAASVGNVNYTVEDAVAQGGTIKLFGNAFIASDLTIPSDVTLILPSDNDTSDKISLPTYGAGGNTYVDTNNSFIKTVLTIQGCTVTVNGKIIIQGLLGAAGGILEGHTSGSHSQIINNGVINLESGSALDVRGYVKGTGTLNANNGATVYSPFVILDFRGGVDTVTVFKKGEIAPFCQYEMPNIQCEQFIYAGATLTGYFDLYAGKKHNTCNKTVIGSDGIIHPSSGYVHKTYNNQKTTLTLVGDISMGSLSLEVKLGLSSIPVSMSDVQFPIPWLYDIRIGDGTTKTSVSSGFKYKILTGASVTVKKNATLNTSDSIIVYSQFKDVSFGGCAYPNKPSAKFIVNGTFNISGAFGGNIQSTNSGAKVTVSSSAATSVSSSEGNSGETSQGAALINAGTFYITSKYVESARFGAGNCTETTETFTAGTWPNKKEYTYQQYSYSGGMVLESGKKYTYNGTSWEQTA